MQTNLYMNCVLGVHLDIKKSEVGEMSSVSVHFGIACLMLKNHKPIINFGEHWESKEN